MKLGSDMMASPLAILNAEQYDGVYPGGKTLKTRKAARPHRDEVPRKRARTSTATATVQEHDEAEDKTKRARGRPRLDTTDQTAADRRRTQIRLAQRAYRSRKENAIQTLEKKVQDLRETNEEMTRAFMKLHDHAVSHGILAMAPDFARELQAVTEVFLSLAKKSSEELENEGSDRDASDANTPPPPQNQNEKADSSSPEVVEVQTPVDGNSAVWGYTIINELELEQATPMTGSALPLEEPLGTAQGASGFGYEVITMPTLDNASFPLDMSSDESFADFFANNDSTDGNSPTSSHQPTSLATAPPASLSPFLTSLAPPINYNYNEISFGRRLQRTSLQRGYSLVTMPDPPKDLFKRIFGFCLLFESVEQIRDRIERSFAKDNTQSLNNWSAPFWALGGTGQNAFADITSTCSEPGKQLLAGNQGTKDVGKHALGTSFGFGPFNAGANDVRDNLLNSKMRINLPGFQGDFYDPDEVDLYLRSKGVAIPPGQDFVTAEVDAQWWEEGRQGDPKDNAPSSYNNEWATLSPESGSGATPESAMVTPEDMVWDRSDDVQNPFFDSANGLLPFSSTTGAGRKIVTIDVEHLVRELVSRGMCLGRSPGFRRRDIKRAFWIATNTGSNWGP